MDKIEELRRQIVAWDKNRLAIVRLSDDRPADWRRQTVEHRRRLQADIAALTQSAFALHARPETRDIGSALRHALNALRSRVSGHQADWPVVTIDPADDAYRQSVIAVRKANDVFLTLATGLLGNAAGAATAKGVANDTGAKRRSVAR